MGMGLLFVVVFPLIFVAGLLIYYRRRVICRSTNDFFRSMSADTRGQDLVEYALMAGFVAVAVVVTFGSVAETVTPIVGKILSLRDIPTLIVRVGAAILAALFLSLIVLRRKERAENDRNDGM
ncbi:MAG: hypothetical protein A3A96_01605 [Candidatus Zambryskibacteria bacterium RIFCSPLOWO2_01_FULL_39_39]|uniref:Uncharacterized protein n=1 Tax=Candidatus Zambryskibacteria bacterium RIFCSPLOWO2_01_FULL_39_39 TaxID=1802758 RepID=A0A1G2TVR0_9BACT|nr:MAG: hypothetical protein UX71_C0002G0288 [Parcubacteria group bacterium GW2011_GWA1_47_10]OHA86751.1 MAG: hypothetical protein A2644_00485 [Candidatus Zambryskibacteria bacterium RIFCSPHIGHO2_01_FULL_39_63]OHA94279.1 MAG: hypothetical protein A3B88_03985 [Candidatus Zambryskibacteria bacterium RIFCSPHIGHO2_02_FULL_39_19]OHA98453.1 MAG: hypothetical protein A3F20_03505 [Candidatus Zambryskibacteria bacterium RIFCSPHIGHO2_12_FULL_39_21]OHB01371.1 MAG: hypothetical protein A3A96_01605 [Candida